MVVVVVVVEEEEEEEEEETDLPNNAEGKSFVTTLHEDEGDGVEDEEIDGRHDVQEVSVCWVGVGVQHLEDRNTQREVVGLRTEHWG